MTSIWTVSYAVSVVPLGLVAALALLATLLYGGTREPLSDNVELQHDAGG